MPESPNDSRAPNDGSSSRAKTHAVPGGAIFCTNTSSRPDARERSAYACRAPWWVTIVSRTPAPSTRCRHRSPVALTATGNPSSLATATVSAALRARRNGSISIP